MLWIIATVVLLAVVYGPQLWVRYILNRYSRDLDSIPGTGGELASHLLERFELKGVAVEVTVEGGDHYSPDDNAVRLSPRVFNGRSLTAVAVAAHEVGHAIQFNRNEPVTRLRRRYFNSAIMIQRLASGVLMVSPIVFAMLRMPQPFLFMLAAGLASMLISVVMYAAILPEEYDASFNKALPILVDGDYINQAEETAVRKILKACALTYVAGALSDVLNLGRWLALLIRR